MIVSLENPFRKSQNIKTLFLYSPSGEIQITCPFQRTFFVERTNYEYKLKMYSMIF